MKKYAFVIFRTAYGKEVFLVSESEANSIIEQWKNKTEHLSFIHQFNPMDLNKTSVVTRKHSVLYGMEIRYEEVIKQ